jgi:hypothetical protein
VIRELGLKLLMEVTSPVRPPFWIHQMEQLSLQRNRPNSWHDTAPLNAFRLFTAESILQSADAMRKVGESDGMFWLF